MKQKRYKAEQVVRILQEAEKGGTTVADLCRRYEVSEATYYRWRRVYGDMKVPEVKRLREAPSATRPTPVSAGPYRRQGT